MNNSCTLRGLTPIHSRTRFELLLHLTSIKSPSVSPSSASVGVQAVRRDEEETNQILKRLDEIENKIGTRLDDLIGRMDRVFGPSLERHLYKHAGRTLSRINKAYTNLKFRPLDHYQQMLYSYLLSFYPEIKTNCKTDWIDSYQHATITGQLIKVTDSCKFNLTTDPIFPLVAGEKTSVIIGEVKVWGVDFCQDCCFV